MISGTVLLEVPGSRAIRRYDRPSASARMTGSSQQRYVRFHRCGATLLVNMRDIEPRKEDDGFDCAFLSP